MSRQTHTVADLAALLGKSEDWVARKVQRREFPHLRVGQSIRFTDAHVDQILASLEQPVVIPEQAPPSGLSARSRTYRRRRLRTTT